MMRACIILRDNWAADEARIFLYHSFIECGSPVFFVAAAILAKAMIIMAVDYMNRGSPCLNFYPPFVRTDDVNSYFYSLPLSESIENLLQANMDTV